MIIGITGQIGVGKTTAAKLFADNGFKIIDTDYLGHHLLKDSEVKNRIVATFGYNIMGRDLEIDRKTLSPIVFSSGENIQKLNKIIHPKLKQELINTILSAKREGENVVIDAALLAEFELESYCDKIVLIRADLETVYKRMTPKYEKRQLIIIMNSQKIPINFDYVIDNDKTLDVFVMKVKRIIAELTQGY